MQRRDFLKLGFGRVKEIVERTRIEESPESRQTLQTVTELGLLSASFVGLDPVEAVEDPDEPANSFDQSVRRFTWWDWGNAGTSQWIQKDFSEPMIVDSISVYWYDDTNHGHCRVPKSWQLYYLDGDSWLEVVRPSGYGALLDAYNAVSFVAVQTTSLRIQVQHQEDYCAGLLRWRFYRSPSTNLQN